mgnify:CR=1 FL=1
MQEWKEKIRIVRGRLAWASLPLCFCGLVLFDAALRFFYRAAGSTRFLDWRAFVFTGAWSLLLTGAAALLPPLGRRIAMGVYAVFFGLLSVVHGVMFNIFGKFFTFSDMNFAGDGAKFFSWSYLRLRKALIACTLLAVLCLALGAALVPGRQPGKRRWPLRVGAAGVMALSLVGVGLLHSSMLPQDDTMWWGNTFDPHSEEQAYKEFTDSNRMLLATGLYQYTVRDFLVSFGLEGSPVKLGELDSYYEERAQEVGQENEMTGAFEGKNLIMVMLESMDTWLLTPEYTPNLYRLQQEGINFAHNYTPLFLSAGTFNTEFMTNTGLLPATGGIATSVYGNNSFPYSLANLFGQQGYTARSFHNSRGNIYDRGTIHPNLGYEKYYGYEDLAMENYQMDRYLINGFDQMTEGNPFFSFVITLSGHGPYGEDNPSYQAHAEAAQAAAQRTDGNYVYAVAGAMETDQFIGELVDSLTQANLLEDTVLIFYADHYNYYMMDDALNMDIKGVDNMNMLQHTDFFIWSADLEATQVDKVTSSVDVLPTIANLFGLDTSGAFLVGHDGLGDQGGYVFFSDGSWYDGETYWSSQGGGTGDPERSAEITKLTTLSNWVLAGDYYRSQE